jgi:energy-coupling factor transporter ATP-binding protein EcfA2
MNLICEFHKQGKTIIVITHDMDLVNRYAERVFLLEKGKLTFEGTPSELFTYVRNYDRLDIPQVTKLAFLLKEKGMDIDVDNIRHSDDLIEEIKKWRAKNG